MYHYMCRRSQPINNVVVELYITPALALAMDPIGSALCPDRWHHRTLHGSHGGGRVLPVVRQQPQQREPCGCLMWPLRVVVAGRGSHSGSDADEGADSPTPRLGWLLSLLNQFHTAGPPGASYVA